MEYFDHIHNSQGGNPKYNGLIMLGIMLITQVNSRINHTDFNLWLATIVSLMAMWHYSHEWVKARAKQLKEYIKKHFGI